VTNDAIAREVERQLETMRKGAVEIYGDGDLRERLADALRAGRPLRVKLGLDPSAPDLHLGHTVVLQKLKLLQDLGHTSRAQIQKNAATYVEQVGGILDTERAEIRFNSEWMDRMSPADLIVLCSRYTVARLLERDDFARRYAAGDAICVHEFLYPFVQAYDSVALRADIELGGTDQTFNLLMAREIQRDYDQPPQAVITHPLLVGTDGRDKMSKSLGNTIGITDPPEEIYGRIMSISDSLMLDYFDLLAGGQWEDLAQERERLGGGGGDPLAFKRELARRLVERFHDDEAAARAAEHFQRVIQRKQAPEDLEEVAVALGAEAEVGLLDLLERLSLTKSRGEARRLVEQNAVSIGGEGVRDASLRLGPGTYLVKVGKRRFARVRLD
jgi:tyrosyl-tRNA synthetase